MELMQHSEMQPIIEALLNFDESNYYPVAV
jgi:hypothetical protein